MKNILLFLILINIVLPCVSEEAITISKVYLAIKGKDENGKFIIGERIVKESIPKNTEQLILSFALKEEVQRIDGIEKLKNIKRLFISGVYDLSFLEKMYNLEIIILSDPLVFDPVVIKKLTKLKILYLNSLILSKEEFDFQSNKQLEFLYLGIVSNAQYIPFELSINNIPESLAYIDLTISDWIIINNKFLDNFKNINRVLLPRKDYYDTFRIDKAYIKKHPNIKLFEEKKNKTSNEYDAWLAQNLPEKYHRKQIYAQLGLDIYGNPLSTGK